MHALLQNRHSKHDEVVYLSNTTSSYRAISLDVTLLILIQDNVSPHRLRQAQNMLE